MRKDLLTRKACTHKQAGQITTDKQQKWKDTNAYLKRVLQSHQKWKADGLEDTLLIQCVLYLLQLHYL